MLLVVGGMVAAWQSYRTQTLRFVLKGQEAEASMSANEQAGMEPGLLVVKEPSPERGSSSVG